MRTVLVIFRFSKAITVSRYLFNQYSNGWKKHIFNLLSKFCACDQLLFAFCKCEKACKLRVIIFYCHVFTCLLKIIERLYLN